MSTRKTVSVFLLLLALLTVMLTACWGGATSKPTSPGVLPTHTKATPASLDTLQKVYVTLWEFKIVSSVTIFKPEIRYRFIITNRGGIDHQFMIVSAKLNPEKMTMADLHKMALIIKDNIAPGGTRTVDYIFPLNTSAGSYEMACHLRGQYQAGMKLSITVEMEQASGSGEGFLHQSS